MTNVLKEIEDHLKKGYTAEVTIRSDSPLYTILLTSLIHSQRFEVSSNKISINDIYKAVRGI